MPTRYWVGLVALLLVITATGIAFLRYRSALEQEDPATDRTARVKPATMTIRSLRLCVPDRDQGGLVWIEEELKAEHMDDTDVVREAARMWAHRVSEAYGIVTEGMSPVEHIFLDRQGVAYVDFASRFVSSLNLGTTAESELQKSLEQTVHANNPRIRELIVMCEGKPLDTWGGHLFLRMEP
jgi:hypothetical protein